jgi:GalNAc5-diNAcBac-PP-undecaprenol beta-1,3-glucosyltransferase
MRPRLSTVITSYNRQAELHRAVLSALNQSVRGEIIVADDCSDFDIHAVLAPYGAAVRAIRAPRNGGCSAARNIGINVASGDFIAFLDDDDYWKPNKIERQLKSMGDCVMATCGQEFVPAGGFNVRQTTRVTRDMLKQSNPVCGPSGFVCRRDLLDKVRFDETLKYAEDWDFLLRVLDIGEIAYAPEPLLYYTLNTTGSSMTSAGRNKSWQEIQYRFAAADKHRAGMGEWNYRQRVATITLAHIMDRGDRLTFIGHAVKKAGLAATSAVIATKAARKFRRSAVRPPQGATPAA